ncbi:hypothetical protein ACFST9_21900 [Hymenobacter monticola]|uniref:Cytochrome c domain-containing protein n=1 Tax=Hymenobacter monticola TaxID=1705399 RepID=A0ABY4B630_9BACT|nr:hypothetical protein [Hymenobacter monticola]UOE34244.1 hypothetical protein MTP16_01005 [Hymenobacter monticola]
MKFLQFRCAACHYFQRLKNRSKAARQPSLTGREQPGRDERVGPLEVYLPFGGEAQVHETDAGLQEADFLAQARSRLLIYSAQCIMRKR